LDEWIRGHSREAQGVTVELVWRLVSASCPAPLHRRFPLGDSIGQHGSDGELETVVGRAPFVPDGKSFWEIGAGIDARAKANSDYNSLKESIPLEVRTQSSFIFVTPLSGRRDWENTWKEDGVASWVADKKTLHEWENVHVWNGATLIDWLYHFPAVERWLAGVTGMQIDFIETLDARWDNLRLIGNPPPLSHDLFTISRDAAGKKAKEIVSGSTGNQLKLDTKYLGHGADFISALVSSFNEDERVEAIGRCLIISHEDAWPGACSLSDFHVLIADFDLETDRGTKLLQAAISKRHAVIFSGMPGGIPHGNRVPLPTPNEHQIKEALEKSQYPPERARTLSNSCGGDLNALLRCVQGLSAMPEWAQAGGSVELAIAMAMGAWKDQKEGDRTTIEAVVGKAYGEWIGRIREITSSTATPLQFRNGAWRMTSRYEAWRFLGKFLFDDHVEKFKNAAISTLREKDPRFDLPVDERYLAGIKGKELTHSTRLRRGLAETLALMGSDPEALTACTDGVVQGIAIVSVREILKDADWLLWATLNDVLPLLAEAAPYAFIEAVDGAIHSDNHVFRDVFAQESSGITGGTYITGILWGLESLAWSSEHLVSVCRVLADFAAIDPGGNWVNRPSNTLTTILLPWFPQTCAPAEKRYAAMRVIMRTQPEVAWKLLLTLLPDLHGSSSETHKPIWRRFIPDDWKNGTTTTQERNDVIAYSEMAVASAGHNVSRLIKLIERYFRLPSLIRSALRERLISPEVANLPEIDRLTLWTALSRLVGNYRRFADHEHWRVPPELLVELDLIIDRLEPTSPEIRHRRLFTGIDADLYEETGDYDNERRKLEIKRQEAVQEIVLAGGLELLISFAKSIESTWQIGFAYGSLQDQSRESDILPSLLESESKSLVQFASGYVWARFRSGSWTWIDQLNKGIWTAKTKGQLLALLPFNEETWSRVQQLLGAEENEYWKQSSPNPYEAQSGLDMALEKLIEYDRADSAISCIQQMSEKVQLDPNLVARALNALRAGHRIDAHAIGELITLLQKNPATNEELLLRLEVAFLPVLGEHQAGRPKALSRQLAESPESFCDIIRLLFRSNNSRDADQESKEVTEEKKEAARRAYRLLSEWKTPPGSKRDGSFDGQALSAWVDAVKQSCIESGHWDIAANQLGEVLYYAPKGSDDLWIDSVCEVLDLADGGRIRSGLTTEIFNSRGTFWYTAGNAEDNLASKWERIASAAENKGFSRLAQVLRQLADSYHLDAERERKNDPHEIR
jgi:hypothetical protein